MFVVLLTYVKPLEEIDRLMQEHMKHLHDQYAAGRFLMSGRRQPRTGGVILAVGEDPNEIVAVMDADPFVREGAATYEVVQFNLSQAAKGFREWLKTAQE